MGFSVLTMSNVISGRSMSSNIYNKLAKSESTVGEMSKLSELKRASGEKVYFI